MKRLYLTIATFCLLTIGTHSHAEQIYRWLDAKGQTHYGSSPPKGINATEIKTYGPSSDSAKALEHREAAKAATVTDTAKPAATAKVVDPKTKERNCEQALAEYNKLKDAPRIRIKDDKGQSVIASEDQRKTMLSDTQSRINSNCTSR